MVGSQWNIYWVSLDPSVGSEQAGRRPVLVVSSEIVNQALPLVTVVPLTSLKPGRVVYPTEALLPAAITGLPKDSIAMAHQIRTISGERLHEQCGCVKSEDARQEVRRAMMIHLDLQQ